jgi:hypothetical protein
MRSDYDIRKTKFTKLEEKYTSESNMRNLLNNPNATQGMSKAEVNKAERDGILKLHEKTDQQGELINAIGQDLVDSHKNMVAINAEVKQQGETINRVQGNVQDTNVAVKRADKNITVMQRRAVCWKVMLHILAILLFLVDLAIIIWKATSAKKTESSA